MTKLLPFDLEAAKAGAKVVTRDGRPARIVCWDAKGRAPLIALIPNESDEEIPQSYSVSGRFRYDNSIDSSVDLFLAPTLVKRWRVVYRGADDNAAQRDFETEAEAENFSERGDFNTNPFVVEVTP